VTDGGHKRERAEDAEDADPGLARERTRLAWTRSSISFAAIGAVILKYRPVVGVPVLLLSGLIWTVGRMPRTHGEGGVARRRVLFVAICVTIVAAAALAIALAGHSAHGLRL
jgi:uncharacterized membrane protein YidH (DUF202 family)